MPIGKRSTFKFRGDRWSPAIGRAIERRLQARREQLADQLEVGLNELEARGEQSQYPANATARDTAAYVKWRHNRDRDVRLVRRIDLAIEELTGTLRRCWALLRDVNLAASDPRARQILADMARRPEAYTGHLDEIDPNVRGLLEDLAPGGWIGLEQVAGHPASLRDLAECALGELPAPGPGRPRGSKDYAGDRLARDLADIYASNCEREPMRVVDFKTHEVSGPYKDFVELIMEVVPPRLRRTSKGGLKSVDHLVRVGVDHIRSRR